MQDLAYIQRSNYLGIHGTIPGDYVAGDSHLSEDIHQILLHQSQNAACEALLPACFEYLTGPKGLVSLVAETIPYALPFGSEMDQITNILYTDYAYYISKKPEESNTHKEGISIFSIVNNYFNELTKLGEPITWAPVGSKADKSVKNKITMCVIGEVGSGKSTSLNLVG